MKRIAPYACVLRVLAPAVLLAVSPFASAQTTLGGLQGTVTDPSGAVIAGVQVTLTGSLNGISLKTTTRKNGVYQFQNLPVGAYSLTFEQTGFQSAKVPAVSVSEGFTGSIGVKLKLGSTTETVQVDEQPLLNEIDTTNGYTLNGKELSNIPLSTGSYTRAAVLTPGVNTEMLSGIGSNEGLGNSPIWANGQRDTDNSFQVDGVDVTNLFNGKTSSESESQRYGFNIGQTSGSSNGGVSGQNETSSSVYGSNGNALASPPVEFIQELSVNTSSYDSTQGNRSGAQIDVNTSTGNNQFHGQAFGYRATNFINASPYFNRQAVAYQGLPSAYLTPQLHRDQVGATLGGPILHNRLFFFLGYENQHVGDATKGYTQDTVPYETAASGKGVINGQPCVAGFTGPSGLTNDRSVAGIFAAANAWNQASCNVSGTGALYPLPATIDPVALTILQTKLSNGQYLIPSANETNAQGQIISADSGNNAFISEGALFRADLANGALDFNVNKRDRLSAKYFYQHSPTEDPFANANTYGFPQFTDNGAQVGALVNTTTFGSRINWEQRIGFSRTKDYGTYQSEFQNNSLGIGFYEAAGLPGISLGKFGYSSGGAITAGPNGTFANAGYFQNRIQPETNVVFTLGKHNLSAGGTFAYTQLNIRNRKSYLGQLNTTNFVTFITGQALNTSSEVLGITNRYYRANEGGAYVQDQFRPTSNLSLTAGVRYDLDGGFSEKYGNLFNFAATGPYGYSTNGVGFIVAGNNKYAPTPGVSNTTLTGRQWGVAPRVGFAYTPKQNGGKIVFRGSAGMYYDRGEYFQYLSQPAGGGVSGPFGVTQQAPLANTVMGNASSTLENPLGLAAGTAPPQPSANPASFNSVIVTAASLRTNCGGLQVESKSSTCTAPYYFADYNSANKLPYTINFAFNVQVELDKNTVATIGYAGALGRHAVIPIPFNEPGIATPSNPINGETSSYGYDVLNTQSTSVVGGKTYYNPISTEPYSTPEGGNVDLRVPYIGYSANATSFVAAGVSSYNALQVRVERRLSNHVSLNLAYTFSHALDEQSDIGLFFTGDNPARLRDSYAKADFDRTNVLVFNYVFTLPNLRPEKSFVGRFTDGWQLVGITTLESGEPYSLYDYNGAVGSVYFGNSPELNNPVLGIKDGGHPNSALTHQPGTQLNVVNGALSSSTPYIPLIDNNQLAVNFLAPGQKGVPLPSGGNEPSDIFETDFTPGQRNIFRQSFQRDADVSLQKITKFNERFSAKYTFDVFNVTNTSSFDIPNNSSSIGSGSLNSGLTGAPSVASGQIATSVNTNLTDQGRLYTVPANGSTSFGAIRNTISSPRVVEMSLHLLF